MALLTKVAKSDSYEISICDYQNYIIMTSFGVWDKSSHLEYYLDDITCALQKLNKGFNMIINLSYYRGTAAECVPLHIEALKLVLAAGVGKTAVVLRNDPIFKVAIEYIIKEANINAMYFSDIMSAERWIAI